jgi:hypothetical protein
MRDQFDGRLRVVDENQFHLEMDFVCKDRCVRGCMLIAHYAKVIGNKSKQSLAIHQLIRHEKSAFRRAGMIRKCNPGWPLETRISVGIHAALKGPDFNDVGSKALGRGVS